MASMPSGERRAEDVGRRSIIRPSWAHGSIGQRPSSRLQEPHRSLHIESHRLLTAPAFFPSFNSFSHSFFHSRPHPIHGFRLPRPRPYPTPRHPTPCHAIDLSLGVPWADGGHAIHARRMNPVRARSTQTRFMLTDLSSRSSLRNPEPGAPPGPHARRDHRDGVAPSQPPAPPAPAPAPAPLRDHPRAITILALAHLHPLPAAISTRPFESFDHRRKHLEHRTSYSNVATSRSLEPLPAAPPQPPSATGGASSAYRSRSFAPSSIELRFRILPMFGARGHGALMPDGGTRKHSTLDERSHWGWQIEPKCELRAGVYGASSDQAPLQVFTCRAFSLPLPRRPDTSLSCTFPGGWGWTLRRESPVVHIRSYDELWKLKLKTRTNCPLRIHLRCSSAGD
ncbi:hypothetical protein Mp_3g06690 [Marchantia polymorpha subsp. ruderalis]|uniref:Uncharacterized protein n=2 Tax=Marchantia polymorpha TaxID=3197 RepID=A0AAF6AY36_MARPO|nr:hypothetical protein MARPO_0006s0137 [Marchantia polymorpha]BBN04670.1 hypothetical protein Mp_3g06690 [Marchantia polymorpha subsp. ruderalis]|eukprot:PTQ48107.1 hypothetical protein MARPO_0006s0137 [Marchantia polymorpha]